MEFNDIKKEIYKQKPIAFLRYIREGVAYYYCMVASKEVVDKETFKGSMVHKIENNEQVSYRAMTANFEVPCTTREMGNADFTPEMDAKLLLRWMQKQDENFQN